MGLLQQKPVELVSRIAIKAVTLLPRHMVENRVRAFRPNRYLVRYDRALVITASVCRQQSLF